MFATAPAGPAAPPIEPLRALRPRRVCLIKPSSLGDIAHAFPLLACLRRHWPDASIAWVVNRGLRSLVDGHPDLDEVIPFDRAAVRPRPGAIPAVARFVGALRGGRFDLAIDAQGLLRSALMGYASGAPVRVGLGNAREGATRFYHHRVDAGPSELHAVDRLLRIAAAFGADLAPASRAAVACSADDRAWAESVLAGLPRPILALNVGARWLTKRWPPAHFAEVARRARARFGAGIVLVGAPEDRPLVDELKAALGIDGDDSSVVDLAGRSTLPQLAALAGAVDLFLSNDTGPLHLAAAAGAATLGVYTCTRPERTGPHGPRSGSVRTGVWCAGSLVRTCDRLDCMAELTPSRVWPSVERRLASFVAAPH